MEDLDNKIPNIIKKPLAQTSTASARSALRAQEQAKLKATAQQRVLLMLLGAALFINLIFGYFLYGMMVQNRERDHLQQLIDHEMDARVQSASTFLSANQNKLDELAHHPTFIQALSEKNKDSFQTLSSSFVTQLEDPLGFNIFIVGEANINRDGTVPIRFAELDLIRRAEHREKANAEAALINDTWQINFVSPVAADKDQPVLGTLMLTLSINTLNKNFEAADSNLGESILQQK